MFKVEGNRGRDDTERIRYRVTYIYSTRSFEIRLLSDGQNHRLYPYEACEDKACTVCRIYYGANREKAA